jgi:hypothetical protein
MRKFFKFNIIIMSGRYAFILVLILFVSTESILKAQIVYQDAFPLSERKFLDSLSSEMRLLADSLKQARYQISRMELLEIKNRVHVIPDGYFDVFMRNNGRWKNLYGGVWGEYNFGSVKLVVDDKIYSYGGSGFWRTVHTVIGFLADKGEWELLKFSEDLPSGIAYNHKGSLRIFGLEKGVTANLANGQYEMLTLDSFPDIYSERLKYFMENENWLLTRDTSLLYVTSKLKNTTYALMLRETPFYNLDTFDFIHITADSFLIYKKDGTANSFIPENAIKSASLLMKDDKASLIFPFLITFLLLLVSIILIYNRKTSPDKDTFSKEIERKYEGSIIAGLLPYRGNAIDIQKLDELLGVHTEANPDTRKYKRAQIIKEVNDTFAAETNQKLIIRERGSDDGRKYMYRII